MWPRACRVHRGARARCLLPQCLSRCITAPPGPLRARVSGAASMSVVKTYCGHGIGDLFHCAPNIPHYAHNKAVGVMKEGQV